MDVVLTEHVINVAFSAVAAVLCGIGFLLNGDGPE